MWQVPTHILNALRQAPEGQELRWSHGDGCRLRGETPDRRRRLYGTRRGVYALLYCHNCGYRARVRLGFTEKTLSAAVSELQVKSNFNYPVQTHDNRNESFESVYRLTTPLPTWARVWLVSRGLTDVEIEVHGFRYLRGIFIPLVDIHEPFGYQIRRIDAKPKYISRVWRRSWWMHPDLADGGDVVLVEDVLSAIVVGRVRPTIALLGHHVADDLLRFCRTRSLRVTVWLDPDATLSAVPHVVKWGSILGHTPRLIIGHTADPKLYPVDMIRKYLC